MTRALRFRLAHAMLTVAWLPSLALTRLRWWFWLTVHRVFVGDPTERRRVVAMMEAKRADLRKQYREHVEALREP